MNTNIIAIGSSKGVIIPSHALKKLNLSLRSPVDVEVTDESIVIKPVVAKAIRVGWAQDAMLASQEPDELAEFDTMNEEDDSWWTWK
jgi:antitoxin component of MazEF toxin-antitoxin module